MARGTTITVLRPFHDGTDRLGNPIEAFRPETVDDVLVSPGPTSNLDATRPQGAKVAYTLHFPKPYAEDLRGCHVELPQPWGGRYRIVGQPVPYMEQNTPTRWWMPAEVEVAHG